MPGTGSRASGSFFPLFSPSCFLFVSFLQKRFCFLAFFSCPRYHKIRKITGKETLMNFQFDPLSCRYPSRRTVTYGTRGMVCAAQPLAAQAGLDIMKQGGNAFDGILAAAACMMLMEPMSCNMGGDGFALIWHEGKLYGLNASGPAPMLLSLDALKKAGYTEMPRLGWGAVTVPGVTSGWAEINRRFGSMPLSDILAPAISYAREGFPVAPVASQLWKNSFRNLNRDLPEEQFSAWASVFAPDGRPPEAGSVFRAPAFGDTLEELARTGCESFYRGAIADAIDAFSRKTGGYIRKEDLASYHARWVEPITTNYRGYDVWEMPPNGHGLVVLMALNILEGFDLSAGHEDPGTLHLLIEAMKLAFADGKRYIADPDAMKASIRRLLSKEYAGSRRSLIGNEALDPVPGDPYCGDTVYLCAADGAGNMVSYIQSTYAGFGSGISLPGTGIVFQNRGNGFTMDETRENCVGPGKRPYHTIIPGFLTKDGKPVGPFGVMGGFMQPQGHLQVLTNMIDFHMNPQEALDAPRFMWTSEKNIQLEYGFGPDTAGVLSRMGHSVQIPAGSLMLGRGQIILRDDAGTLCGASEPRTDGMAAAW